eukprot:3819135-Pleurochrysis_carterae.AAC.1
MNEVLRKYGQKWAFSENKGQRDTRPSGNESRALLTSKGILRQLLCVRYGLADDEPESAAALNEMSEAQGGIRHIEPEPDAAQHVGRKRKVRTAVTSAGLASARTRPPPPPPPPPPPKPSQPSASSAAPNGVDGAAASDDDDDFDDLGEDEQDENGGVVDVLPGVGAESSAGDLKSASKVWLAVIELNEVLHKPFDDTSRALRAEVGAEAQAKGRAWACAMRAHSGNSI